MLRLCMCVLLVGSLLVGSLNAYPSEGHPHQVQKQDQIDAAVIVRRLVHAANWAAVGSIPASTRTPDAYPTLSVISIDDSAEDGKSTGKIHFYLVPGDYISEDWRASNSVTFLLTEEQNKECEKRHANPMGHACARAIISGQIVELDNTAEDYKKIQDAFVRRHPDAERWPKSRAHSFYLCELDIKKIEVMGTGGYHGYETVTPENYYSANVE